MRTTLPFLFFGFICFFTSCVSLKESPKYELRDGIYRHKLTGNHGEKVYVEVHNDTVQTYKAREQNGEFEIDQTHPVHNFPEETEKSAPQGYTLFKPSFDLDFVSIPVKYRPETSGFPRQLNSSLSGAVYIGSRYDIFRIRYNRTPLGVQERSINHYGFSLGLFGGLGSTFMNPWVTEYAIDSEYDGVVFMKGIAFLGGFNNFTAGVALGFDNLLDQNREFWIYENEVWIGLTFGLNLN